MSTNVLKAINITKHFYDPIDVKVLDNVNLDVNKGEFVSLVGKSGCGKSTLLYILSTMDRVYEGQLFIDTELMSSKNGTDLAHVRNEKIGFVFQFHYLLNEFSVLKNVMLPALKLNRFSPEEIEHRAIQKLELLGINKLALRNAGQISGGEKQRVAIARALINDPLIIMGDEPTGNLDLRNSQIVFDTFKQLAEEFNQTLLIVTHDLGFAEKTHRIVEMEDGKIIRS
jgi:lipoprotein-releasing system ATP-binding protein